MIFIYVLKCPLSGRPRYVGKTQTPKTRLSAHISKARSGQTQHHCARWIRQLLEIGLVPNLEVIFEVPAGEEWQVHEKRLVARYIEAGYELTNLTGGGGGFYKPNQELLERRGKSISRLRMQSDNNARFRARMREVRSDPSVRAAHSAGQKAAWQDPGKRLNIVSAMNTPESKRRRSEASRRRQADPVFAAGHRERMKRLFQEPERLMQIRKAQSKRWERQRENIAERRVARELARRSRRTIFIVEQAERLRQRWRDDAHRELMHSARWTQENKARQAAAVMDPVRQAKIKQALTPDVIARRNASIKESWARRRAQQQNT